MTLQRARTLSIGITRPLAEVAAFLADPRNFPAWASGLGNGFAARDDGTWQAETPLGPMRVRFSPPNPYGILDHWVIPAAGEPMYNPMRVIANDTGSEVTFTLFQRPGMSDAEFARDKAWVERDLAALKLLLENHPAD